MDSSPWSCCRRVWLAILSLVIACPALMPLEPVCCAATAHNAQASEVGCQSPGADCCHPDSSRRERPDSRAPVAPLRAGFCHDVCQVYVLAERRSFDSKRVLRAGSVAPRAGAAASSLFRLADCVRTKPGAAVSRRPTLPPSALLRTVARRCFPSHAPPVGGLLVS
jgi:hypothetical protein